METNKSSGARTLVRAIIIAGILIILLVMSYAVIKIVPKAFSTLASANISLGTLFSPKGAATSTNAIATSTTSVKNNGISGPGGFTVISTSTQATTTTKNTSSYNNQSSNTYVNHPVVQNGLPDLAIAITSKGIQDPTTGKFIETNNVQPNDRVIINFIVTNQGSRASGSWTLRAQLPAYDAADRLKTINGVSIPAGQAISGQVYFDRVQIAGNNNVILTIDPNGSISESDKSNNVAQVVITSTGTNTGTTYTTGTITNGSLSDLSVNIIATGILDSSNNFVQTTPRSGQRPAVRFQVVNNGGSDTGTWYFNAFMSGQTSYTSDPQPTLGAGQKFIYTIGFNSVNYGTNAITINVDPTNIVRESNEGNNTASASVYVGN